MPRAEPVRGHPAGARVLRQHSVALRSPTHSLPVTEVLTRHIADVGNGWAARRVERRAAMDPTAGLRAGFWRPFSAVGRSSGRQHVAADVVALGRQHATMPSYRVRPGFDAGPASVA